MPPSSPSSTSIFVGTPARPSNHSPSHRGVPPFFGKLTLPALVRIFSTYGKGKGNIPELPLLLVAPLTDPEKKLSREYLDEKAFSGPVFSARGAGTGSPARRVETMICRSLLRRDGLPNANPSA